MQNIDPVYFLTPVTVIAFSFGLVIYWRFRKGLTKWVILYSFIAYFGAIALKYAVQIPTIHVFQAAVGGNLVALGLYYGLQTVVFEVGGAYLVAYFAFRRKHLGAMDAEGYGLALALWENGVWIGLMTLINYAVYYAVLSSGSNSLSQQIYDALSKNAPSLFFPPSQSLPLVGFAILERVSSLFAHFSWGLLVVFAVVLRKKTFLVLALPMGLIDFLVPFVSALSVPLFELVIFLVSLMFLVLALTSTRNVRKNENGFPTKKPYEGSSQSLTHMNFRRAANYGRVYLIMGVVLSFIIVAPISAAGRSIPTGVNGATQALSQIPALILPLFAIIGSMGGLMIFTSDKTKGVYEYLIAYGVSISNIFWSIVLATVGLASIVLVVSIASTVGILIATGASISFAFVELIVFYAIPISYTSSMFMSMAGMIWSSLATRRAGVNSPVGLAPVLGIIPVMAVLILSSRVGAGNFILLIGMVSIALVLIVGVMIAVSNRNMVRERFLSNA